MQLSDSVPRGRREVEWRRCRVRSSWVSGLVVSPFLVLFEMILLLAFIPPMAAADGAIHALLINGGSKPASNFQSHLHHLQDMVDLLEMRNLSRERIYIFSADGEDEGADLAVRDSLPDLFWLIDGTGVGKRLKPKVALTNTQWAGVALQPATKEALRGWFSWAGERLKRGDQLFIFVTDHGTGNSEDPDNGAISLWQDEIQVSEFQGLLALLPPGVQTVMVMSQCYSGSFAAVINGDGAIEPDGATCGFFSTKRDLKAYGCYPEGRDRDRLGHAFQFITALGRNTDTANAHREVLMTDDAPDVPIRTSDVYLERIVAEEAKSRRVDLDDLVDRLLSIAWRMRGVWENEIRLLDSIGSAFGTFSPRTLAELDAYTRDLPPLIDQMKTFAKRWKTALVAVQEEVLADFLKTNPSWEPRLKIEAIEKFNADDKKEVVTELLPQFKAHLGNRPELSARLERLREKAADAAKAGWRLETRKAALLRMRTVLITMAGQVLLRAEGPSAAQFTAQRTALEQLRLCEAWSPGALPAERLAAEGPAATAYPPLAAERELLEEVLPSYLGVRFRDVPAGARGGRALPLGASWIEGVFPDSPAMAGGLEVGDIILGPPGEAFSASGQLREWTMTAPRETPLTLRVLRPDPDPQNDRSFEAQLLLRPLPLKWPDLPGPPRIGDRAPRLPGGLEVVGKGNIDDLGGRDYILFFWATWCQPCKVAVPEVLAFARDRGMKVLAISDEDAATVAATLNERKGRFFEKVAVDGLRKSFIAYGVSGTPTIILVDQDGIVRHRQVGYKPAEGLTVEGWGWSKP